jgi:secreted trypsin-like serine protease
MKRIIAAVALAAAVVPAGAITWGSPDGEDHPNVVALLFVQNGVGFFGCSGTLLTPYVVLTAGHCTEGGGKVNSRTYVRNTSDIDAVIASELPGFPNVTAWLNATWVRGKAVPHPDYDDYAEFVRYAGTSSVTGLAVGDTIGDQNFKFSNNPGKGGGPGGTCSGDSGGPAFWIDPATRAETNIVMAVNSYGIAPLCNGNDYQFRTDIETAQDFILPHLEFTPD